MKHKQTGNNFTQRNKMKHATKSQTLQKATAKSSNWFILKCI